MSIQLKCSYIGIVTYLYILWYSVQFTGSVAMPMATPWNESRGLAH